MIEVQHLSKTFQVAQKEPGLRGAFKGLFNRKYRQVHAVRDISFLIKEGELVGFLGPNGAGKTTTLKMLSGLLHPSSGEAHVLGHIPWKRERAYQQQLTMVMGQRTQLWWDLPAWDSFLLNKEIFEIPTAQFDETVKEISSLLEIDLLLDVPVKKLSLGQRMKAELACSLLHRPRVLLLDEPTIGLDVVMQQKVRDFILEYNKRHRATILLTSHNMDDVAELCSRVLLINHGRLLFDGTLPQLKERFGHDRLTDAMRSAFLEMEHKPRLKKYWSVFSIYWQEGLSKRASFLMERFRALVVLVSFYYFWSALLKHRESFVGYDRTQMLTYVLGINILRSFVFATRTEEIAGEINHGRLSAYLLKPINFMLYTFFRDLSEKSINLVSAVIEVFGLMYLFGVQIQWPQSATTWLLFAFSVLGAMWLYFILSFMTACWGFWTSEAWGPRFLLELFLEFTAGAFFPLDVLPEFVQKILMAFPSPYLVYFPLQIFLGKVDSAQIMNGFLILAFWIAVISGMARLVWLKGMKSYSSAGI